MFIHKCPKCNRKFVHERNCTESIQNLACNQCVPNFIIEGEKYIDDFEEYALTIRESKDETIE